MEHPHHFYGKTIHRSQEQELIQDILKKYANEPVNDVLKKKVYDELAEMKASGRISIPFKVLIKQDPLQKYPPYIEVVLDTKV